MKDLPSVQAFPIEKKLSNYQERFDSSERSFSPSRSKNIIGKINEIFHSNDHVYKSRVRIKTEDDILERLIIGKTQTELLSLDGTKIAIKDILDIEKI